jgi:inositol oxygenase
MKLIVALLYSFSILQPLSAVEKEENQFRDYAEAQNHVVQFYKQNHAFQTFDFVTAKQQQYLPPKNHQMSIWEAMEMLDTLIDESDPDIGLPQSYHLFQTAEAMRADDQPRWFILTGLIHDLGKILAVKGESQWAVVGDTFPIGCAYSDKNVFPEFFALNPDSQNPDFQSKMGIYAPHCGLDQVLMSWGHDEYLYQVVKDFLPVEASFIIRFHSFYALHQQNDYHYLLNDQDFSLLPWLKLFQKYDLYSKTEKRIDIDALRPYYQELVSEFFPGRINW